MESNTFTFPRKKPTLELPLFFASDIHRDHGCDEALLKKDLERAGKRGARIYLNGDTFSAILPKDMKRYTRGSDKHNTDAYINEAIEQAEETFRPYVDLIDLIGCGNHETTILKYHSVDMTLLLIGFLNRHRSKKLAPIAHGGYTGFFRYLTPGPNDDHTQSLTVFYNHGQGGSAEVTDGIIDIKRRAYTRSDVIWLGHKHKRFAHEIEPETGIDRLGRPYEKKRWGIMTGSYQVNIGQGEASTKGYQLNYAEERMRTPQGRGGIHATIYADRHDIWPEFII
jgi:hypothetical protein